MKFINLYQIFRPKVSGHRWSTPVPSESDEIALNCFKTLSLSQPELSCSYLYCIGKMNLETGKIRLKRNPRLIKDKHIKELLNEK